ncbi:MAG TPA: hypothetical protein VGC47_05235 [Acidimicrobiia bacterium]|jgi:hypothetical protein
MRELESLADLLELQEVDLQIDRLLNERASLPELERYRNAAAKAAALAEEHQAANAALRDTTLALDKTSGELELAETKLAAEQNRLYAGGLSARDADFLRQQVAMLVRKNGEMEDEILELMEKRDQGEKLVAEIGDHKVAADTDKAGLEASISEVWQVIDAELADREAKKADIIPLIADDLLELYDELRGSKEGVAVGRLTEGTCGGCHLVLTEAEQLEAKRSDPPRCIHCRRILVP